jgi:protein-S-isoprenylcysteine O-methyltransferase Ste14
MNPTYRYIFLLLYFSFECFFRQKAAKKAMHTDKGSTFTIGVAFFIAILISPLLNSFSIGFIPLPFIVLIGNIGMLSGLFLRGWSMNYLGAFYTRFLTVTKNQKLITTGPYTFIRHPGYTGSILFWTGFQLAARNSIGVGIVFLVFFFIYSYRITIEEIMLTKHFGKDFKKYTMQTKKLIPLLY